VNIKQRVLGSFAALIASCCALCAAQANAISAGWRVTAMPRFATPSPLSEMDTPARAMGFDQAYLITAKELWQIDARSNASDIAYLSRQAIGHSPHRREAYQILSLAVRNLEHPSAEDVNLVKHGHSLFPADGGITLGLAVAFVNTNEPKQAIELIENVLSDSLATEETVVQAQLIHSWILQSEYCPKIRALVKDNKFEQALALNNEFRGRSIDESALQTADAMRTFIEGTERIQLIEIALQDELHASR
jgi:hypothetical protein